MITSYILIYLYALFVVWVAYHTWKNYDAISMFNPWKWICGSSHSANAVKGIAFVIAFLAAMSLVGYVEAYQL